MHIVLIVNHNIRTPPKNSNNRGMSLEHRNFEANFIDQKIVSETYLVFLWGIHPSERLKDSTQYQPIRWVYFTDLVIFNCEVIFKVCWKFWIQKTKI